MYKLDRATLLLLQVAAYEGVPSSSLNSSTTKNVLDARMHSNILYTCIMRGMYTVTMATIHYLLARGREGEHRKLYMYTCYHGYW